MHAPENPETHIHINEEEIEFVNDFTYLGSIISKDNGAKKDLDVD